jgi:formylglycine-generating enzyme required for sulfatase activity
MKKRAILLFVTVVLINCSFLHANQADINKDGRVNYLDIAIMAQNWLWTVQPDGMVWVYVHDKDLFGWGWFAGEMSKYETTNDQYCQFLNAALASGDIDVNNVLGYDTVVGAGGYNAGADFVDKPYYNLDGSGVSDAGATNGGAARINYLRGVFTVDSGYEDHPVTYVTLYGAKAFCNYYLYRLPTEVEWEGVANYDGTYMYACGDSINAGLANYEDSFHPNGTLSVGYYGDFGYGLCDMAGNVYEWTDSCEYPTCTDEMVIRGGSWNAPANHCEVTKRFSSHPNLAWCNQGFRVCR